MTRPKRSPKARASLQEPGERRASANDDRPAPGLRYSTIIVANMGKLVGFGIAINEMVIRTNARSSVIAFCALCVLGTQAAEDVFLKFIDKMFSQEAEE